MPSPEQPQPRPAEGWRAVTQAWVEYDSPCGRLRLAASARGLCALLLPEPAGEGPPPHPFPSGPARAAPTVQSPGPPLPVVAREAHHWLARARRELDRYFDHQLCEFTVPLDLRGTPFQVAVWRGLLQIPYGTTRSYAQLAAAVGRPRASRAVGQANHVNPLAIIVPCHRVIGADGSLTGYGGGLDRKRWLLAWEAGVSPRTSNPR